jgi:hypothetical protein
MWAELAAATLRWLDGEAAGIAGTLGGEGGLDAIGAGGSDELIVVLIIAR